jgi:hypothetical protein
VTEQIDIRPAHRHCGRLSPRTSIVHFTSEFLGRTRLAPLVDNEAVPRRHYFSQLVFRVSPLMSNNHLLFGHIDVESDFLSLIRSNTAQKTVELLEKWAQIAIDCAWSFTFRRSEISSPNSLTIFIMGHLSLGCTNRSKSRQKNGTLM